MCTSAYSHNTALCCELCIFTGSLAVAGNCGKSLEEDQNCSKQTDLEDALQVGVVSSKAMVGGSTPAEEQRHGVTLIPKGRLHSDEDIAKLPAIDQQVLPL